MNDIRIVLPESAATLFRLLTTPCHVVEFIIRAIVGKYDRANGREDAATPPPPPPDAALPWAIVEQDVDRQIGYYLEQRAKMADGGRKGKAPSTPLKPLQPPLTTFNPLEAPSSPFNPLEAPSTFKGKGKVKGKGNQKEIKTQGKEEDLPRARLDLPRLGDFSDETFFDPEIDPVYLAMELTNDISVPKRNAFGALLRSIGAKRFRNELNTYWHELCTGEVPDDLVAALLARLRKIEQSLRD